ncbi:MAG: reverse transcriptase domain-containing protein [Leptolyngbyaceae cyanobacterium]
MSSELERKPEVIKKLFFQLKNRYDLANILEISEIHLRYQLYILDKEKRYVTFQIPKKSGKLRDITTPVQELKVIQKKLNTILKLVYRPKNSTHGFTEDRNIITNAEQHLQKRCLLNIDLEDFFPSINFGRVRGLLSAAPYNCNKEIATMIANLCTHNNCLPQGAPTSPILSNMICASLDTSLQRLAKKYGCIYTRYADDITFSTSHYEFPIQLVYFDKKEKILLLGEELLRIVERQGFKVNQSKTRLRTSSESQEVTGIIVNEKLNVKRAYVRQVRAMLHAWEKYGLENAQSDFQEKYYTNQSFQKECPPLEYVVKGKIDFIGQVRGRQDKVYQRFLAKLSKLSPELVPETHLIPGATLDENKLSQVKVEIWTEGKTDITHLRAALKSTKRQHFVHKINLTFNDRKGEMDGEQNLYKMLKYLCLTQHEKILISIFDRDNSNIVKEHLSAGDFKYWGNNVYSFVIPTPSHRDDNNDVCIELYYHDDEIKRKDKEGRRLFFGHEFIWRSGRHKNYDLNTRIEHPATKISKAIKIIDDKVFDSLHKNVALTKNNFADNILNSVENFNDFNFSEFELIFDVVRNTVISSLENQEYQK